MGKTLFNTALLVLITVAATSGVFPAWRVPQKFRYPTLLR
jgi:hypothetical protein